MSYGTKISNNKHTGIIDVFFALFFRISFLLGNSHILDKISENADKVREPKVKERRHACQICEKSFFRKSNLLDHLRLHANQRLYRCDVCGKAFVQAGNLRAHLRIHTKERPYACTMCPKTYNQTSALKVSGEEVL